MSRAGKRRAQHRRVPVTMPVSVMRPDPQTASRLAGDRGRAAPGVEYVARVSHYQGQNGPPFTLTARQQRRLKHKSGHQEAQARRAIDARSTMRGEWS